MSDNTILCRCSRSLAVVCSLFASMAAVMLLAEDRCLDAGGRVSDSAWMCETAAGLSPSIWSLVSALDIGLVAVAVGLPVYVIVNAVIGRLTA